VPIAYDRLCNSELRTGTLVTVSAYTLNQSPRSNGVDRNTLGRQYSISFRLGHTMKFSMHRSATCKETQEPANISEGDSHLWSSILYSIKLTKWLRFWPPGRILVQISAGLSLVEIWPTRHSPIATASRTASQHTEFDFYSVSTRVAGSYGQRTRCHHKYMMALTMELPSFATCNVCHAKFPFIASLQQIRHRTHLSRWFIVS
jgi:hypothetical protein